MAWIEEITQANETYFATRRQAKRHPACDGFHGERGPRGIRRDQVEARASRNYRTARAKLGLSPLW